MRARNNVCSMTGSPRRSEHNIFHIIFYTSTNPFIHLLGSSLIQWMIVRINGREEPKQDLQVRLDEIMLRLSGEVRLGRALLCLGGPKNSENLGSGSLGRRDLRLGMHSYA